MATPPRQLPIPRPLILTGNLTTNWKVFKRDWNTYEIASKLRSETAEIRVATLLSCIGRDAINIFDGFQLTEEQNNDIQEILDAFEKYCIEETNESHERFVFNSRNQQEGESIDKYVAELRKLAKTCNVATLEESLIRDRIITGIKCDITRRKLLQETKLTLIKCIDICRSI
ncbi:retrovirus-related Pol polyprotein from transposon 17.6 [Elysia marginata]|uniref:Retrovirus-related Pol polyprotein from transposon 17.6 n=1 Tax=Elysia marginata TaxID=1093978 RepID=A0AAV4HLS1_9GAST|nr:retrovirus-related Pol polyprotein from transposon 17.6 [Elysia marginata]